MAWEASRHLVSRSTKDSEKIISLPKNEGTTVSRNLAVKQAKGDILIIMDSDVEFNSYGFKDMINYLLQDNYILSNPPKSTTREDFGYKYLANIKDKFKQSIN